MRTETRYIFEVTFWAPNDVLFAIETLRGAASGWATCSNESEPLLHLADQLAKQLPA